MKELNDCKETSIHYKEVLENLTSLNFDKPNDYLKKFAETSNLDLKNENVQKEFFKLRDDYIKKVDDFYERNFGKNELNKMINQNPNLNSKKAKSINAKSNAKQNTNKNDINQLNDSTSKNKNDKKKENNANNHNKDWSLYVIGIVLLSIMLGYYIFMELWKGLQKYAHIPNDELKLL